MLLQKRNESLLWRRREPAMSFLAHQSGASCWTSTAGEIVMFHCSAIYKINLLERSFGVKVSLSFSLWQNLIPRHCNYLHSILCQNKSIGKKYSHDSSISLQAYKKFRLLYHTSCFGLCGSFPTLFFYWNMIVVFDPEHTGFYSCRQCEPVM